MISDKKDITDEEFEEILLPFFNNYSDYIIKFLMPDAIAFLLQIDILDIVYQIVHL